MMSRGPIVCFSCLILFKSNDRGLDSCGWRFDYIPDVCDGVNGVVGVFIPAEQLHVLSEISSKPNTQHLN